MIEQPMAGSASAAAPEHDVLLATKLYMPASRPDLVPRPRLADRLDEGLAQGLIVVCAPAGYGKTVLLADWARRGGQPAGVAVAGCGGQRPGPVLAPRGGRAGPGAARDRRPGGPAARAARAVVVPGAGHGADQRAGGEEEALLVLDDYHVIGSAQVHESLAFLVEHRPAGIGVVLASRSDPPLALARLRARGQLTEIREAELRFTPAEAGELFQHMASALPDASVAALAARTEGWAAGLQLAALSLRGHEDAAAFVAAFTGSHRYVLDYLAEEVLEQQDEQLRTFLLETSVLERRQRPVVRRRHRRRGQPGAAGAGGAGGPVLDPAG